MSAEERSLQVWAPRAHMCRQLTARVQAHASPDMSTPHRSTICFRLIVQGVHYMRIRLRG